MNRGNTKKANDFDAIALSIASPDQVLSWSRGEVTKPETINYRTQKPERDGLFCEKIFGPTKNWECYCGKYKRIRYKGIVCEKCGVEVTRSVVRRERMGHIDLAVPLTHIWFLRSTPSRIGLLLDLPVKQIEQVVYFASYIVISIDEEAKQAAQDQLNEEYKNYKKQIQEEAKEGLKVLKLEQKKGGITDKAIEKFDAEQAQKVEDLDLAHSKALDALKALEIGKILTEVEYRELSMKFGHVFVAGTGAESIRTIIENIDLKEELERLQLERAKSSGQKQKKLVKRIKFVGSMLKAGIEPKWMIIKKLPVIPPDLRPMVQLDGGRFAASDLNDLYRRVINRNNRLKRLMSIGAPEVICRNEKRMLQEAVDTLLNNSARAGKAVFTAGDRRKLRSLSDMLKGKQGRFRQNLLGKRVDYSGRSVIVVGPHLELHQCGLPKEMLMKLFKPFVIGELIRGEYAYNVKGAEKLLVQGKKIVWDILERVIQGRYVLLNRAPTLHRLGIQAFQPIIVEGKAIQIHPLVCAAFNADFDGDQMAVHVPLSAQAQAEAKNIMASNQNLLKPSAGKPVITPTQDMILGCYFLTQIFDKKEGEGMAFVSTSEAINAYRMKYCNLQAKIKIRHNGEIIETSVGRTIFNSFLPEEVGFINKVMRKGDIENLISEIYDKTDIKTTSLVADKIKRIGFKFATKSGLSIAASDIEIPEAKYKLIEDSNEVIRKINNQYWKGLITEDERYSHSIKIWSNTKSEVTNKMIQSFRKNPENHVHYMIDSGARGNWGQITQLCGMKGLVANPSGKTIELPIKSNLKEGFTILEYFIATHGGRKGKSDTALKTAEAGYLTRRLVDAVQDIIIRENDCGSEESHTITRMESERIGEKFENRIFGRTLAEDLKDPKTKKIIAKKGEEIGNEINRKIEELQLDSVRVRSIITCLTENGICQKCYGRDLGTNKTVEIGTAVGIIAAQSIGEPGTQLTMRTFHMGGVAEGADITQGLTRVEELFEARSPKTPALLSEIAGEAKIKQVDNETEITIKAKEKGTDSYNLMNIFEPVVKKGDSVKEKQIIAKSTVDKGTIKAKITGIVDSIDQDAIVIKHAEKQIVTYYLPVGDSLKVKDGDYVQVGQPLNAGHLNLASLLNMTNVYNVQKYIVSEVQHIYASQGQTINDKHIEIIAKQMFSKVKIIASGNTDLLPGEVEDIIRVNRINNQMKSEGKNPAIVERLLLGLTRISLSTHSWLSAASFQETIRVLVEASTTKNIDRLNGLKENVIIGKLIPAGDNYRRKYQPKVEMGA